MHLIKERQDYPRSVLVQFEVSRKLIDKPDPGNVDFMETVSNPVALGHRPAALNPYVESLALKVCVATENLLFFHHGVILPYFVVGRSYCL